MNKDRIFSGYNKFNRHYDEPSDEYSDRYVEYEEEEESDYSDEMYSMAKMKSQPPPNYTMNKYNVHDPSYKIGSQAYKQNLGTNFSRAYSSDPYARTGGSDPYSIDIKGKPNENKYNFIDIDVNKIKKTAEADSKASTAGFNKAKDTKKKTRFEDDLEKELAKEKANIEEVSDGDASEDRKYEQASEEKDEKSVRSKSPVEGKAKKSEDYTSRNKSHTKSLSEDDYGDFHSNLSEKTKRKLSSSLQESNEKKFNNVVSYMSSKERTPEKSIRSLPQEEVSMEEDYDKYLQSKSKSKTQSVVSMNKIEQTEKFDSALLDSKPKSNTYNTYELSDTNLKQKDLNSAQRNLSVQTSKKVSNKTVSEYDYADYKFDNVDTEGDKVSSQSPKHFVFDKNIAASSSDVYSGREDPTNNQNFNLKVSAESIYTRIGNEERKDNREAILISEPSRDQDIIEDKKSHDASLRYDRNKEDNYESTSQEIQNAINKFKIGEQINESVYESNQKPESGEMQDKPVFHKENSRHSEKEHSYREEKPEKQEAQDEALGVKLQNKIFKIAEESRMKIEEKALQRNAQREQQQSIKPNKSLPEDKTGLTQANREISQIQSNAKIMGNYIPKESAYKQEHKFDKSRLVLRRAEDMEIEAQVRLTKKDLRELKLESALTEERKRRDYFEINFNRLRDTVEDLDKKILRLRKVELENKELQKIKSDTDRKYKELEDDMKNLISDYEEKLRLAEDRIVLRESKGEQRRLADIERIYKIEVHNLKSALQEKLTDLEYFEKKSKYLEEENTKLSINKLNNLEVNEKIKELQNENFLLHEKNNELISKLERLGEDKETLSRKLLDRNFIQKIDYEVVESTQKQEEKKSEGNVFHRIDFASFSDKMFVKQEEPFSVFDQLMIEREQTAQENLIKAYQQETTRLSAEIKALKNINAQLNRNIKVEYNLHEKPILKKSAEEKIQILIKHMRENSLKVDDFVREYESIDNEGTGEISNDKFQKVFSNLKIPLDQYEVLEIFNNYYKLNANKILFNDFVNSLKSSIPSNFYIQSDPSYIQSLEKKLIQYENKSRELQSSNDSAKEKILSLEKRLEKLADERSNEEKKCMEVLKNAEEEKRNSHKLVESALLHNNYIRSHEESPEVRELKRKILQLEQQISFNQQEFTRAKEEYERKLAELKGMLDSRKRDEIVKVSLEANLLKEKLSLLESKHVKETEDMTARMNKYKKNYSSLQGKLEKVEQEKERLMKQVKDPNGVYLEEMGVLERKIELLERKNRDREEHYRQICLNVNSYHTNKELELQAKRFDKERQEYLLQLNSKNNELKAIKSEFDQIIKELEQLKAPRKLIR